MSARTIQYILNDYVRGCLKFIYNKYQTNAIEQNIEIENVYFSTEELNNLVDQYYKTLREERQEGSKKGIVTQLKSYLKKVKSEKKEVFYLRPLTNLLRLKNPKIENEILYIGALKYSPGEGFDNGQKVVYSFYSGNEVLTFDKERFIRKIQEMLTELERRKKPLNPQKKKPLNPTSLFNISSRTITNMEYVGIILNYKTDKSLNEKQIRIKQYIPDYRVILILYLNEKEKKNQIRPEFDAIVKEYELIRFFMLDSERLKKSLKPGLENNLFHYQEQIGNALKMNFNQWEISKK